ncbi:MAG TPA: DUF4097 family beta strand repeat-containing protein [Vicinamibacterales bacterium]
MKSVLAAAVAVSAGSLLCGCVVVDSQSHITREEKRFTVSGSPDLHLTTYDGPIEIRSGDDARTVVVEIEKRGPTKEALEDVRVETKQNGNRIDVEVRKPAHEVVFLGIGHISPSASLIVTMPREGNIVAKSGDGSIRIDHIRGRLELRTGDGSVRGNEIGGQVTVATGDGSVTLDSTDGELDVDTGDGSVRAEGKLTVVKLHTGDGSITLRAEDGSEMKEDWSISTGDGGVAVSLPSRFGAELDAHSEGGTVRSEFHTDTDRDGESTKRALRGRIGSGGKTLKIRTGDGSIRLKSN